MIKEAKRLNQVQEYYFSQKLQEIRKLQSEGKKILNLGIGNPDLSPSSDTIESLAQSARQPGNHGYQSYRSAPELRQAIALWYERIYGVLLNPENEILPLIGSKEGIMHISMAFLNMGDEVLIPDPGYPTYTTVSLIVGAKIRKYDLLETDHWSVDIDKLKDQDLSKVKIMWINYPHMPTGAKGSLGLFEKLVALAIEKDFLLCNDNPYSLILNDDPRSILAVPGAKQVCLELNSLSKSHNMAGWRLGWVCGGQEYLNSILKVKSNVDSGMFLPIQHAAIKALSSKLEWHRQQNQVYHERRKWVWQLLDLLDCHYEKDQVGLFVWAKIPDHITKVEKLVDDILYKAEVFITPGFIFGDNGARFVRVSLCNEDQVIQEAIQRIKKFSQLKSPI